MFRFCLFRAAVGCALAGVATMAFAQPPGGEAGSRHQEAATKFEEMKRQATRDGGANARFIPNDGRFVVSDCEVPNFEPNHPPFQTGIAVWFELADTGRFVNPVKHRWNPRERFRIHIESAVPVTVSLHQNYPEDRPPSRIVYPDQRYPRSFDVIPAGRPMVLPVMFQMDDDLRPEIMSMVVARADSGVLPPYPSMADAGGNTGTSGVGGGIRAERRELMTQLNDEAFSQNTIKGSNSRFNITGPGDFGPEFSNRPHDVQFFMLGVGKTHQWQITLNK